MRIITLATLMLVAAALVAADRPAPAQIVLDDGRTESVFVAHDNMDEVVWSQDDRNTITGSFSPERVVSITYDNFTDPNYVRGRAAIARGDFDKAIESLTEAAERARYEATKIEAYLLIADAHARKKNPDSAAAALDKLIATYPKSSQVPVAQFKKGEYYLLAKEYDKANAAFSALGAAANGYDYYKAQALAKSALGLGRVLMAQGDFAGAATQIQAALKAVDPDRSPAAYLEAGLILAEAQQRAGDTGSAQATYTSLLYLPGDPVMQGRAHVGLAKLLDEAGQTLKAFDHAVMGAVRGAPEAKQVANSLAGKLSKDESIDAVARRDYRNYVSRL